MRGRSRLESYGTFLGGWESTNGIWVSIWPVEGAWLVLRITTRGHASTIPTTIERALLLCYAFGAIVVAVVAETVAAIAMPRSSYGWLWNLRCLWVERTNERTDETVSFAIYQLGLVSCSQQNRSTLASFVLGNSFLLLLLLLFLLCYILLLLFPRFQLFFVAVRDVSKYHHTKASWFIIK